MGAWDSLSIREKAEMMKAAIRNGITTLPEIKQAYNEFAEGGNIYDGTKPHSSQMQKKYIYDVLPGLFAQDGVKISVTSGYRPGAVVRGTNKPSRHGLKQAADIVGDFDAIRRVLDDPNSNTSKWLLANGYGYLDETSKTGTTKFWHDKKRDHSHYHIGTDKGIVASYAKKMQKLLSELPQQQETVSMLPTAVTVPEFIPYNPQAFFGQQEATVQMPVESVDVPQEETATNQEPTEENNNFGTFNTIMELLNAATPQESVPVMAQAQAKASSPYIVNRFDKGGSKKSGGSFYQTHRARWFNFLREKGVNPYKAERLASYFSAQDALESGHGTSDAARRKNNYGGMQRLDKKTNKMVNVSYGSINDYMNAKWKMMNSKYSRALNAKSIQEYANILNDPKYHGKGYIYGLYEGYRDGQPLDVARQTKYMNDYTRIMMDIAGEKGFKGADVPDDLSIVQPENPYTQFIPFEPFNPQAFNNPQAFVAPTREQFEVEQPIVEAAKDYAYSPEQLEKEERRQGLNNLSFILGMMNGGNENSFADTIGMLTGNIAAEGGKIHIKPENRGKFTALKERTGHSATWFKEHGTPAQKKMATFALNARHWKHGLGGNLYEEGGPEKKWKALDNIDFVAIPDTSFTRDKTGVGSIEYFDSRYPEGITYPNGYHREHPLPGKDVILYNPNDNDKQDIRLDALHIMPKDATYDTLYSQYLDEIYTGQAGDLAWKGVKKWEDDAKKYGKNNIDTKNQYIRNEADGLLRNSLIEGDSDYRKQKGYSASKSDAVKEFPTLVPYVDAIQNYLVTGERPANILQEVTITGKKRRGKKHGYGGHIYDGTTEDSQLMNTDGGPFSYIQRMLSDAQNMSRFARKPSYEEALRQAGERVEKERKNLLTTSNDNTWVGGRHGKQKNEHLEERGIKGANSHALWEQEHPNLTAWGNVLSAAPIAVASAPFVSGVGDALAGTAAGQAATSGLTWLANAAKATPWVANSLPWVEAGLNTLAATEGAKEVSEGNFTPMTALELLPLVPPTVGIGNNLYLPHLREHVFASKAPIGYGGMGKAAKEIAEGVLSGRRANVDTPAWFNSNAAKQLQEYAYVPDYIQGAEREQYLRDFGERALKARTDMWRMYNRLPQKYNTFSPSKRHPGAYTASEDIEALKWVPQPDERYYGIDFVNSVGGNTGRPTVIELGRGIPDEGEISKKFGVTTVSDLWDLHPFSRPNDRIISRLQRTWNKAVGRPLNKIGDKIWRISENHLYDTGEIKKYIDANKNDEFAMEMFDPDMFPRVGIRRKIGELLRKEVKNIRHDAQAPKFDFLKPIDKKVADFEIGRLINGRPIMVKNDVPWTTDTRIISTPEKEANFVSTYTQGFNSDNLFPSEVDDWRKGINRININDLNDWVTNDVLKGITKSKKNKYGLD